MSYTQTVEKYLEALQNRDGAMARTLFTERGAIDDYRGRHHAGRDEIARFINQVSRRQLDLLSDVIVEQPRATIYGRITYPSGDVAIVRWIFHFEEEMIDHLGNTRIEQVPADRLR